MFVATVSLRGLGHDRGRGVAALHVTGGGAYHSTCRARLQSEGCAKRCEGRDEHRDHDFDDLLFGHTGFGFRLLSALDFQTCSFFDKRD